MSTGVTVEIRRHSASAPWTYVDLDRRQREIALGLADGQREESGQGETDQKRGEGAAQDAKGEQRAQGALLLSEVAPVVTIGRRTPAADLLYSEGRLGREGIALARVDRGGLATYHGPGQWVLFAVDRLERLTGDPRGVRRAVEGLLGIALEAGSELDPTAEIRSGAETGVWTARGKFASVGVHVERGVLLHGLAINAFRTATSFTGLRPCGLEPRVDYLFERAGFDAENGEREAAFQALGERLRKLALGVFWSRSERLSADIDCPPVQRYTPKSSSHVGV